VRLCIVCLVCDVRNLLVLVFGSLLIWDVVTVEIDQSVIVRATTQIYSFLKREIEEQFAKITTEVKREIENQFANMITEIKREASNAWDKRDSYDSVFSREAIAEFIDEAASRTGIWEKYLHHLAERESSFNPVAEAGTSTAAGLYQFVEQTWLDVFSRYGVDHGQDQFAKYIRINRDGRRYVANSVLLKQILNLRFDPKLSTFLAAHYTNENQAYLERSMERKITYAELYMAHFLGAAGAVKLLRAVEASPQGSAVRLLPAAARANRGFFYDRKGRPVRIDTLHKSLLALCGDLAWQIASSEIIETSMTSFIFSPQMGNRAQN